MKNRKNCINNSLRILWILIMFSRPYDKQWVNLEWPPPDFLMHSCRRSQPSHSMETSPSSGITVARLLKNFTAFYETRRFITVFTKASHLFLSWPSCIQFINAILFSYGPFNTLHPPKFVFLTVSYLLALPPKPYMHYSMSQWVLRDLSILCFFTWSFLV
jgi:hypothetical protein